MSENQHEQRESVQDYAWRKSTFSNASGNCVEVAAVADGSVAVRNSRDPHGAVLHYTRPEIDAFIRGAKAGEFDYLTR
ncbi:DUF397 domain-containing protein [Nocardia camponoti]|nr:DUF397 domain-containing protein [Nocardia camponoti]